MNTQTSKSNYGNRLTRLLILTTTLAYFFTSSSAFAQNQILNSDALKDSALNTLSLIRSTIEGRLVDTSLKANNELRGKKRKAKKLGRKVKKNVINFTEPSYEQACEGGGTFGTSGRIESVHTQPLILDVQSTATLNQCGGLNGFIGIKANAQIYDSIIYNNASASGSVNGLCAPTVPLLLKTELEFETQLDTLSRTAKGTVSGTIQAFCGDMPILSCGWYNDDITNPVYLAYGCFSFWG